MTANEFDQRASASRQRVPVIPVAIIVAVGVVAQFFTWIEADVAWLLTVARRMNAGAELYSKDLVEFNPPLVMQLSQVTVWLGHRLHIDTILSFRLTVALLAIASLVTSWRLLRQALPVDDEAVRGAVAMVLAAALTCVPGLMFGQREHIVVLGFVPYLIAAGLRADGRHISPASAVASGIALALAVSIKPPDALAIVLVEARLAVYGGGWRAWVRLETVVGAAALAVVQAIAAMQFPGYLAFAVPLAIAYYPAYGVAHIRPSYVVYAGAALAAWMLRGLPSGLARQRDIFVLAGFGAFGGYLVQGQGWEYQFLPAQTFFLFAVALALVSPAVRACRTAGASLRLSRTATTWLCLLTIGLGTAAMTVVRTIRINRHERSRIVTNVRDFVSRAWPAGQPRSMASLTLSLFPAAPVAELEEAEWASRFSCLWLVPGIDAHEAAALAGREQPKDGRAYLESAVVEDFVRWQPTLVLVEAHAPRVLDDVLRSPAFQREWSRYRSIGTVEGVEVFRRDRP